MDARLQLLNRKMELRMLARQKQADDLRRSRRAALRGDVKAGGEFENRLDSVMGRHGKDTTGNFPHKSPVVMKSKPLTDYEKAHSKQHGFLQSKAIMENPDPRHTRAMLNPSLSTRGGGKFENVHYKDKNATLEAARKAIMQRALRAKLANAAGRRAKQIGSGLTRSQIVKKAWVTRKRNPTAM